MKLWRTCVLLAIVHKRHGKPERQRHRAEVDQPNVAHAFQKTFPLSECLWDAKPCMLACPYGEQMRRYALVI